MAIRRVRPCSVPTRSRNHVASAAGLVAQPQPGELDQARACPRVARPAYASIAVHASTLVGHGCDADVTGELAAVGEGPIEHLAHQYGGEVRADAADALKGSDLSDHRVISRCGQCLSPLGFQLAD